MSVSIPVVDDEPDVADLFRQRFVEKRVRARTSCMTRLLERRRWTGSR